MEDMAPALIADVTAEFRRLYDASDKIRVLLGKVREGTATFAEAQQYSLEVSRLIGAAYEKHISSAVLPDERMYFNIASRLIPSTMDDNYRFVSDYAVEVQKKLNEKAGIGLRAKAAEKDADRIEGLVNLASSAERYDDVSEKLLTAFENFSQSIVDKTIEANADFQYRAGLHPKIIRRSERKCCQWCSDLAGEYDYPMDMPEDVFRRHENCRCTVLYDPADGKHSLQNVHTKLWTDGKENDILEKRKNIPGIVQDHRKKFPINPDTGDQYTRHPVIFSDAQFGKKVGKHASDFGMRPDSQEDRNKMRAIIENIVDNADERYFGEWAGQESPVIFHILGDDVVVESKYQEFVTVLKGGTSSARVKKARGK